MSLEFWYKPQMDAWTLRAEYRAGSSIINCSATITSELLVASNAESKEMLFKATEKMARDMNSNCPWISYQWLVRQMLDVLHNLIVEAEKTQSFLSGWNTNIKASAGTHSGGGALDITKPKEQPLADWEKELLGDSDGPTTAKEWAELEVFLDEVDDEEEPSKNLSKMADNLPGMTTKVTMPCECYEEPIQKKLKDAIMHLNDIHPESGPAIPWTTEQVCEWLDELHDSGVVNLEIEIPDKEITNADSN